jgi:hypothetical protein
VTRLGLPPSPGRALAAAAFLALAGGCVTPPSKDFSKFVAADPRSILVVPVVNNSVNVDAADYFLSTIPVPVAERGYYVFPVHLVKRVLEDDGLSDASLVHGADPIRLAALFGADAVLYATIQRWEAKYVLVTTQVTVEFEWTLKDGKTGDTLWRDHKLLSYASDDAGGGLIGALVNAAITKAAPDYMRLARQASGAAVADPARGGFPAGPYRPEHEADFAAVRAQAARAAAEPAR